MRNLTWVGVLGVLAIAGCKKAQPTSATGSGSADLGSSSASTTGSAGSATGSAGSGSATGSAAGAGSGSASGAGSGSADGSASGAGAGSSAAGSAAGSGSAAYDKQAFLDDPLCEQVLDKIRECHAKPEFIQRLDEGATAKQKKINAKLRNEVKDWQDSHELCGNTFDMFQYQYSGFLDEPVAFKAPTALASCADIASAVKAAGGLVGGDTAM